MRSVLCLILTLLTSFSIAWAHPQITINIPEYALTVTDEGQLTKKYAIAVGTPYEQTPTGAFAIFAKIVNPTWYPGARFTDRTPVPPGPDNPLGTRWMEFTPSYGIHGTNKDWDITYPVSGGCVRMHDRDARELFSLVSIGTPVRVVYETLKITEKSDGLYLTVFPDIYNKKTSSQDRFLALFAPYAATYEVVRPVKFPLKEADDTYEFRFAIPKNLPPRNASIHENSPVN